MKILNARNLIVIAVAVSSTTLYADVVTTIQVSDKHTGAGVPSSVELILPDYKKRYLGRTDSGGVLALDEPLDCRAGMALNVEPNSTWYRKTKKDMVCTNPEVVAVRRRYFDYWIDPANRRVPLGDMFRETSLMYMGFDVHATGGAWQEIDGRLAQTDASAWLAGAMVSGGIRGKAEYSFDVSYVGGLEDNAIGFGALVPGFVMGLVWDPANLGGSGLHAQVYNADGEIHEYGGVTYDFEVPESIVEGIMAEMAMNAPLTVRLRVDSSSGNVWVKDPF